MPSLTLASTRTRLSGGDSIEAVVSDALAAAENSSFGAFVSIDREGALNRARELDQARKAGKDLGPLAGVPVAVKDNICTKGLRTTCGSKMIERFVPPYSATAVEKLQAAGAVVDRKSAMDAFGMGS